MVSAPGGGSRGCPALLCTFRDEMLLALLCPRTRLSTRRNCSHITLGLQRVSEHSKPRFVMCPAETFARFLFPPTLDIYRILLSETGLTCPLHLPFLSTNHHFQEALQDASPSLPGSRLSQSLSLQLCELCKDLKGRHRVF